MKPEDARQWAVFFDRGKLDDPLIVKAETERAARREAKIAYLEFLAEQRLNVLRGNVKFIIWEAVD